MKAKMNFSARVYYPIFSLNLLLTSKVNFEFDHLANKYN